MQLKYNVNDRLPAWQLAGYSLQWFVLAVAVVSTSVFVATGTPAEKLFYAQKLFAVMGITGIIQIIWGHRLPLVTGPAAVLLVGVISSLKAGGDTSAIYSSIAIGGALISLLTLGGLMRYVQRLFTPRIVVVILMLIAFTLSPVISNLIFVPQPAEGEHLFGLIFAIAATLVMVALNKVFKGVAKSLIIPLALIVGSVIYYAIYPTDIASESAASWRGILIEDFTLDWGMVVAFVICYIALLINDIGSIESLGAMLKVEDMPLRMKRGVRTTGVMNIISGAMGVLGPVNYSMSPGIIASTGCASRWALIPACAALVLCALSPDIIWILSNIPNPVIGTIMLYLMGTQVAAGMEMAHTTGSARTFGDALTIGLPLMVAMLFTALPMGVVPQILQPLMGNGFAMGVITVIIMEHIINRSSSKQEHK